MGVSSIKTKGLGFGLFCCVVSVSFNVQHTGQFSGVWMSKSFSVGLFIMFVISGDL